MARDKFVWVTAGEGRVYPFHPSVASAPGGRHLRLGETDPAERVRVDRTKTDVIRALADGDLVEVDGPLADPAPESVTLVVNGPAVVQEAVLEASPELQAHGELPVIPASADSVPLPLLSPADHERLAAAPAPVAITSTPSKES